MKEGFYYLSQPYNGTEAEKQFRFESGAKACIALLKKGISVFSPIAHNHSLLAYAGEMTVQDRRDVFLPFDLVMLARSEGMLVLKLEGWEQSHGVGVEIHFCQQNKKPIYYIEPAEVDLFCLGVRNRDVVDSFPT